MKAIFRVKKKHENLDDCHLIVKISAIFPSGYCRLIRIYPLPGDQQKVGRLIVVEQRRNPHPIQPETIHGECLFLRQLAAQKCGERGEIPGFSLDVLFSSKFALRTIAAISAL